MPPDTLSLIAEHASLGAFWLAFVTGFLFSFNPVALASIPVSLAYLTVANNARQALLYGAFFILGMILTHVALGLIASMGGEWVQYVLGRFWGMVLGPLLMFLGLIWLGLVPVRLPSLKFRAKPVTNAWGAFALGIPFSVAICPFCTPALVVLLGVAASTGSPLFGATLLLAFALGRTVPILIGALGFAYLENLSFLKKFHKAVEMTGGILLVISGLYMLNAYFIFWPELAG